MKTLKAIKQKHKNLRVKKLSRNGVYGILISRVYIGIREIKTPDGIEEAQGACKAIITEETFTEGEIRPPAIRPA